MATVTASIIKNRHPEFSDLDDSFVTSKIEQAYRASNETTLRDQYDDAAEWFACHLIAVSPFGVEAQLIMDPEKGDIYYQEWLKIARPHGRAQRTLGE